MTATLHPDPSVRGHDGVPVIRRPGASEGTVEDADAGPSDRKGERHPPEPAPPPEPLSARRHPARQAAPGSVP